MVIEVAHTIKGSSGNSGEGLSRGEVALLLTLQMPVAAIERVG